MEMILPRKAGRTSWGNNRIIEIYGFVVVGLEAKTDSIPALPDEQHQPHLWFYRVE